MRFTLASALLVAGALAQQFTNSSTPAVQQSTTGTTATGPSTFSPAPTPAGTVQIVKLTLSGRTGGFQYTAQGIFFNTAIVASQGDQFNLAGDGSFSVTSASGTLSVFVAASNPIAKRQTATTGFLVQAAATVPAGSFTTFFSVANTIRLVNNGITYNFALTASGILAVYNAAGAVPVGFTAISVGAIGANGAPAATNTASSGVSTLSTATATNGTGAVAPAQTVTSTVVAIVANVNVNINIVISITAVGVPFYVGNFISIVINGQAFSVSVSEYIAFITSYRTIGTTVITPGTAVVVVRVVPVVIPATQFVVVNGKTTTIIGVVSTVGRITTVQGAGGSTTTRLTVSATSTITASSRITVSGGAAVVTSARAAAATTGAAATARASAAATTAARLPTVNAASGASQVVVSAALMAAAAFALVV